MDDDCIIEFVDELSKDVSEYPSSFYANRGFP